MQVRDEERLTRRSGADSSLANCHPANLRAETLRQQTMPRDFDKGLRGGPGGGPVGNLRRSGDIKQQSKVMSPAIQDSSLIRSPLTRSVSYDDMYVDSDDEDHSEPPTPPPSGSMPRSKSFTCMALDEEAGTPPSTPPSAGPRPSSFGKWLQSVKNVVRPRRKKATFGIASSDGRMHGSEGGHIDMF
jgi:hypothetical protein